MWVLGYAPLAPNKSDAGISCQRRSFEDFLLLQAALRPQSTVLEGATGDPCNFSFDFLFHNTGQVRVKPVFQHWLD